MKGKTSEQPSAWPTSSLPPRPAPTSGGTSTRSPGAWANLTDKAPRADAAHRAAAVRHDHAAGALLGLSRARACSTRSRDGAARPATRRPSRAWCRRSPARCCPAISAATNSSGTRAAEGEGTDARRAAARHGAAPLGKPYFEVLVVTPTDPADVAARARRNARACAAPTTSSTTRRCTSAASRTPRWR